MPSKKSSDKNKKPTHKKSTTKISKSLNKITKKEKSKSLKKSIRSKGKNNLVDINKLKQSKRKNLSQTEVDRAKLNQYKNYLKSISPLDREKLEFNLILLFMMLMIIKMENKQNLIKRYQQLKNKKVIENKYKVEDFLQSYNNFKKCFSKDDKIDRKTKSVSTKSKDNTKKIKNKTKSNKGKTKRSKKRVNVKGGAYLQRLEDLGDKPITGDDLRQSLDEITEILDSLKYTPKGTDMKPFSMFLNLFRGNDYDLNYRIQMQEAPQYFEYFPPSLNIKNILTLLPDLVEYITIYRKHRQFVNEYLVSTGQLRKEDIKPTELELAAQKFQDAKDTFDSNLSNITSPRSAIKRKMLL